MPNKDTLTFGLRIHDPAEKKVEAKSTAWRSFAVPREDLQLPDADLIAKYLAPALAEMRKQMGLTA